MRLLALLVLSLPCVYPRSSMVIDCPIDYCMREIKSRSQSLIVILRRLWLCNVEVLDSSIASALCALFIFE